MKLILFPFAVAAFCYAAISPDGARAVQSVNSKMDGLQQLAAGASSAQIRAHVKEVDALVSQCDGQLRLLIRDRNEPEVRAAQQRLAKIRECSEGLQKSLTGAGQSNAQVEQKIYQFAQEHLNTGITTRAGALRDLAGDPKSTSHLGGDVANFTQIRDALAGIDKGCKGKYADIAGMEHPAAGMSGSSPRLWCGIAANRDSLLKRSALNTAGDELSSVAGNLNEMKAKLASSEGYLQTDVLMVRRALWDRDQLVKDLAARHQGLLQAAGVSDSSGILAGLETSTKSLMDEAARLAPQWKFPTSGPRDPGPEALARQQVAKEFKNPAVRSILMDDAVFKIAKNRLGIPLERYKDGFLLYRMANESMCRQQAFTYTEKFDGTGYQKPAGVKLQRLRYLNCQ